VTPDQINDPGGALPGYLPIAEHGVIGDLHTAALVGTDGTIDWYCCPHFDSPSVFGAILDRRRGGYYRIAPVGDDWTPKQLYFPDTNVLITRFLTTDGVGEVQDFMPIHDAPGSVFRHRLIRRVLGVRGELTFRIEVEPRFDYGRDPHSIVFHENGVVFRSEGMSMALETSAPLTLNQTGVSCEVTLSAGESLTFVLERVQEDYVPRPYSEDETADAFDRTIEYWRRWLSKSRYQGRWREVVHRSALTLKLLTYRPTGGIVAAPTTSLPEQLGGGRNWDYRYTWIRDAAFSLYALLRLGFTEEAAAFMEWMRERFREPPGELGPLQIMYGIDGRAELEEEVLDHLEGYRGSSPVRIGNGAASQLQLDIYGELIDSVWFYSRHGSPIDHDSWVDLSRVIEWICENWDQADEGIWEERGGRKQYTYSRLMSWVALERAVKMALDRGLPGDLSKWQSSRDQIYHQIMAKGWHPERQAFVQHYDTEFLDAAVLLMPLVNFVAPTDRRWLSTLDAMSTELVSDSLVYRYNVEASPDGVEGEEGTFSICTFWYVEALARAGRVDEARLVFEKMLTYANHLGLYSEQIGLTGEALGNFPQAFTHLALISAAFYLDRELG
jgi:GH15 family glucan-1,4-alpha-glucosidase